MIKNISGLLYGLDRQFIDGIRSFIYSEIQTFVQGNLLEYISHTSKKKKPIASVLKVLQDLASDGYIEERDVSPSKSKPSLTLELKQSRTDPFSLTQVGGWSCNGGPFSNLLLFPLIQLYFMRAYVDFGFNEKSKGMKGGLMKEKDFKENHVAEVDRFFESSILYPYMIDLRGTVLKCSDLSDLWYKEFYLELSKQIQV